jgi:hypothetical protein
VYYVKVATRGAKALKTGSPRQALEYISDGHDARRDAGYSDGELAYIARMGDGWKTDLERGRIPLVGLGELRGVGDQRVLATGFEEACQAYGPWGKQGYKSLTFTVPKEVSLFAEGHREEAKQAMYAAVQATLDRALAGKEYRAVAAVHTRNEGGEIHYHAHVLIGKFARERDTGEMVSLNGRRSGNGPGRMRELKLGWKETLDHEFKERLGLTIEQRAPNAAPALVLADGTRLDPLNRASRRLLEKDLAPWYAAPDKAGVLVQRQLRLGAMDDRIFEIAAGDRETAGWRVDEFRKLFPEQGRFLARHEKRVETLKAMGYLTASGQLTPEFRVHFALRHGINTPDLQRIRLDLAARAAPDAERPNGRTARTTARADSFRYRIAHLGLSGADVARLRKEALDRRPTPERLRLIRLDSARAALKAPPTPVRTKTVIRACLDLHRAKIQRVYLVTAGALSGRLAQNKKLAEKLQSAARRDLFYAKEKRVAQLAERLRPIFGVVQVALPRQALRLEKAVERCTRLAYSQEIRRIEREQVKAAYLDWRTSIVERPLAVAQTMYERGYAALRSLDRIEAHTLQKWTGRELDLVRAVHDAARSGGQPNGHLPKDEYLAAVRAGQVGRLLSREELAPALQLRPAQLDAESLRRLAGRLYALNIPAPLSPQQLAAVAPSDLRKSLSAFKSSGLLDDGPGWTLKAGAARSITQELARTVDRAVDADRSLTDGLIKRRNVQ